MGEIRNVIFFILIIISILFLISNDRGLLKRIELLECKISLEENK